MDNLEKNSLNESMKTTNDLIRQTNRMMKATTVLLVIASIAAIANILLF